MKECPPGCPSCGSLSRKKGVIPDTDVFAGVKQKDVIFGGCLFECPSCRLVFKWPQKSKVELDDLYRLAAEEHWSVNTHLRNDWRLAYDWVKSNMQQGTRILDIACSDGAFLGGLGASYQRFGIEIHEKSARETENKGIKIVGRDYSRIHGTYDLVTAFDLIEHIARPEEFIEQALASVSPNGYLLISTGNVESKSFKFMGSKYWYCTIAEHFSFLGPSWVEHYCSSHNRSVVYQEQFVHSQRSSLVRFLDQVKNISYALLPVLWRFLRANGIGGKDASKMKQLALHPPAWTSASDHFMFVLRNR
ncbi:MAG: 2-polyprenyl-3-methyl-5-hydroxy-6-metoxy-1,4-benzoquinol methylase [Halieaceae bacterium]|jgi:2-polyprenyl-3-methyl-5-hydroxy-6-metoxy-1,4-benzoquinol methylase